nr:NPCBM/NEW2 domain-containing protein [Sulfoacidibacillus ferrooxidans]
MYSGPSTVEWGITTSESAVIPQVTYSLHGQYQTLSGMFAVDDITRNFGGAAQLVFVGDGKVLSSTGWVQGGSAPVPFSIPVTGVNTLQIQYQLKDANGTVYSSGDTYQAPSVNADQVSGPVVFTDLIQPTLSEAATVTVSTSNSASTVTRRIK